MHHKPGLRWLTGLNVINYHSLSDVRVGFGEALRELFEQVLAMLTMKGLITLPRQAIARQPPSLDDFDIQIDGNSLVRAAA